LGADFLDHGFPAEAAAEFREMVKIFPDTEMCHYSLGMALHRIHDFKGAKLNIPERMNRP
jgi:hypothetical protein